MIPDINDSIRQFQEEMKSVDEVVHVILKGHLLIEEALTRVIEQFLFHPEYLSETRLSFYQKIQLARAFALRKHEVGEWELMRTINSLRNELAHALHSPRRDKKVEQVKDLFFRQAAGLTDIETQRKQSDPVIVAYACALCAGYLASFQSDAHAFRKLVHNMDRTMNPNAKPFDV